MPTNKEPTYDDQVRQLAESGQFRELIDTFGITSLPAYGNPLPEATPIRKSDAPDTSEIVALLKTKTNNRKFGRQFAGQTPDWSQKNPTEERDVDSWAEARKRKSENRDWGLPEEHDMSDPAKADPNVANPSRVQLEEELFKPEINYAGIIRNKIKPKAKPEPPKQMSYAELVAHRKENPEEYPEIALEHLEKEGTGGHGVGDGAGAQVANGGAGLASGGTAHVSTSAGIFTPTHGGHRGKKIKRTSDGSHTVGLENFNKRGTQIAALTEHVAKQFLSKRTKGQQKEGLDAQVKARRSWGGDARSGPLPIPKETTPGMAHPSEKPMSRETKGLRSPETDQYTTGQLERPESDRDRPSTIPAKHATPEAVDTHEKREAMRRERMLSGGYDNPLKSRHGTERRNLKSRLKQEEFDAYYRQHLRESGPDHPDYGELESWDRKQRRAKPPKKFEQTQKALNIFSDILDKAKAPYYNRDVQGLNTSTIRDQKSQKKQSKQNNMAGHKRNSIWRNP